MAKAKTEVPQSPNEVATWKMWERVTAAEFVKALIHAHGGEQGDVRWYAARACAFTDALRQELLAARAPIDKTEQEEREATKQGMLPLFDGSR